MKELSAFSMLALPLILSNLVSAVSLDCYHIRINSTKFDLSKLGGPHHILIRDDSKTPSITNTTWTVDICQPLKKIKDIPAADQCPSGTYVCGKVVSWNPTDDPDQEHAQVDNIIPVAGNMQMSNGGSLDPKTTKLKDTDSELDGIQVELHGGFWGNKKQKAVINFECDKARTGNEGNEDATKERRSVVVRDKDDDTKEEPNPNSLTFISYGSVEGKENVDVLRLNWRTKYACEDMEEDDDDDQTEKKGGWGFFTWFVLM